MTFTPHSSAVRSARHFVEDRLTSAGLDHLVDDAGLLTSELAGNAVLHARTSFDVAVHLLVDGGARVEVHDRSPVPPVLTAPSATATSGRGLNLVQTLAAAWGSLQAPAGGKLVWFETAQTPATVEVDVDVDELLAAWADDDEPPVTTAGRRTPDTAAAGDREVVVADLPASGLLAAKEHLDDLLRELQLVLLDADNPDQSPSAGPVGVEDVVALARRLDVSARAFDGVRRQVREQVSRAVATGQDRVTLRLRVPTGAGADAVAFRSAVEAAASLAHDGQLLAAMDDLAAHAAVRRAYLDELITQLGDR